MAVNEANARIAYQYFIGKGLTPAQAAGIVGNLQAESSLNPESTNSIGCIGIAQWCGGRRQPGLQTGDPAKDLQTQLDYMWYELQGPEHRSLTALQGATTAAQAAQVFEAAYERSGGALVAARQRYANEVAALASSWGITGGPSPSSSTDSGSTPPTLDISGAQDVGLNIPNPLAPITSTASFLKKVWDIVSSANFWLRVGQTVAGFALLLIGVAFMLSESKGARQAATALVMAA